MVNVELTAGETSGRRIVRAVQPDAGVDCILLSRATFESIGVLPTLEPMRAYLASGVELFRQRAHVWVSWQGRSHKTVGVFGFPGDRQLIGLNVLRAIGLWWHPLTHQVRRLPTIVCDPIVTDGIGAREHLNRARWFLHQAKQATDASTRLRLTMSAVYAASAIVEVVASNCLHADLSELDIKVDLRRRIRHFQLVADLRKNDFHRTGFTASPGRHTQFMGGPSALTTAPKAGASAALVGRENGMEPQLSDGSSFRMTSKHDKFTPQPVQVVANDKGVYVRGGDYFELRNLLVVLDEYICDVPNAIDEAFSGKLQSSI